MDRRTLSSALAKRAHQAAEVASARHLSEARDLLATIVEKRRIVTDAFWDIGSSLARLKDDRYVKALGHPSFPVLVEKELSLSSSQANKLIAISQSFQRREALLLGQERAAAVVELADARNEDPSDLVKTPLALPGHHERVKVVDLSVRAIKRAARDERSAHKPRRKVTKDHSEASRMADVIERALRAAGVEEAKATTVTVRKKGTDAVSVLRVQFAATEVKTVAGVLRAAAKG